MTYVNETLAKLVRELAEVASVEMTVREDEITIRAARSGFPGKHETSVRNVRKSGKAGKFSVKSRNGQRLKTWTFEGETKTCAEWAEKYGIPYKVMNSRLHRGGSPETVLRRSRKDKSHLKAKMKGQ